MRSFGAEDRTADPPDLTTAQAAAALDASDPLAALRERFVGADETLIYLDGRRPGVYRQ